MSGAKHQYIAACTRTTSTLYSPYKHLVLALQVPCTGTTRYLVLALQASCTHATSVLYLHYIVLVDVLTQKSPAR